jgi:hypothetical protein
LDAIQFLALANALAITEYVPVQFHGVDKSIDNLLLGISTKWTMPSAIKRARDSHREEAEATSRWTRGRRGLRAVISSCLTQAGSSTGSVMIQST